LDGCDRPWVSLGLIEGIRSARRPIAVVLMLAEDAELDAKAERLDVDVVLRPPLNPDLLQREARQLVWPSVPAVDPVPAGGTTRTPPGQNQRP
jgi:hypothetical protein